MRHLMRSGRCFGPLSRNEGLRYNQIAMSVSGVVCTSVRRRVHPDLLQGTGVLRGATGAHDS